MAISDFVEQTHRGFKITLDPAFRRESEAVLDLLEGRVGTGEVIKSNMVRTVSRVEASGTGLILKRYHSGGFLNVLKGLVLPSRASREWSAMLRLNKLGIPTARPVIYGEKRRFGFLVDAFFASTAIEDALPFMFFIGRAKKEGFWNESLKNVLFEKLARLTAALHDGAVFHADFHLGNVLVTRKGDADPDVFIIDLHTLSFPGVVSMGRVLLNLARVAESLRHAEKGDVTLFLDKYLTLYPGHLLETASLEKAVFKRVNALDRRKLKSRTRRCLLESSEFTFARAGGFSMNVRRDCEPAWIAGAIGIHDSVPREGDDRLILPSDKNKFTVVKVETPAGPVGLCVKEYRRKSFPRRMFSSEAKRSWIVGRGLEVRGVATPRTAAWVRGGGREFVVTRHIEGAEQLGVYAQKKLKGLEGSEKASFIHSFIREMVHFIRLIHNNGIRHGDMSEKNILVREEKGRRALYLTDLDTVSFAGRLNEQWIIRNLGQLGQLPAEVDVLVKARFLKTYLGEGRNRDLRKYLRAVDGIILKRMAVERAHFLKIGFPDPYPIPSVLKREW